MTGPGTPTPGHGSGARLARLAVMLSGNGRTLLNLLEHIRAGKLSGTIELVIASRECLGAQRARDAGIRTEVIRGVIPEYRLAQLLRDHGIEYVALAGYLQLLKIPAPFRGRVVNVHPALLPAHGG